MFLNLPPCPPSQQQPGTYVYAGMGRWGRSRQCVDLQCKSSAVALPTFFACIGLGVWSFFAAILFLRIAGYLVAASAENESCWLPQYSSSPCTAFRLQLPVPDSFCTFQRRPPLSLQSLCAIEAFGSSPHVLSAPAHVTWGRADQPHRDAVRGLLVDGSRTDVRVLLQPHSVCRAGQWPPERDPEAA